MPPQDPNGKKDLDPKSFLLPKKEGPSADSAQRINAGALLNQELQAAAQGLSPEPTPEAAPQPEPAPAPAEPKKEEALVKPLQTYSGDISSAVQGGVSMTDIVAAEAAKHGKVEEPKEVVMATPPRAWVYIAIGVGLILASVVAVALVFWRPAPQERAELQSPFVQVDETVGVSVPANLERDVLMQSLDQARQKVNLAVGLIARLYVGAPSPGNAGGEEMPVQTLLATLAPSIPQELLRTLETPYLLGVHSFDENQSFLILRVDSFEQAYSGMLAWEQTMRGELSPLFTRTPEPPVGPAAPVASSTATTTASTTPAQPANVVVKSSFVDRVVENHDARVIETQDGQIVFLWALLDRSTVVITTNESTLREIIRRSAAQIVPIP